LQCREGVLSPWRTSIMTLSGLLDCVRNRPVSLRNQNSPASSGAWRCTTSAKPLRSTAASSRRSDQARRYQVGAHGPGSVIPQQLDRLAAGVCFHATADIRSAVLARCGIGPWPQEDRGTSGSALAHRFARDAKWAAARCTVRSLKIIILFQWYRCSQFCSDWRASNSLIFNFRIFARFFAPIHYRWLREHRGSKSALVLEENGWRRSENLKARTATVRKPCLRHSTQPPGGDERPAAVTVFPQAFRSRASFCATAISFS
jgi:hypothetical protein